MKRTLSLFLFGFLIAIGDCKAQAPKSFSNVPADWFKEMKTFLQATNKKDADDLMEKFEPIWLVGKLTSQQQLLVTETSNSMLRKRLKAFPDFNNYLIAIIGFTNSSRGEDAFKKWHLSLDKMLAGTSRKFSDYLEISSGLFASNTLYESATVRWVAGSADYIFDYDSMPRISFPSMNLYCYSKGDSSIIYNVKGVYYPLRKEFIGTGGKVDWSRAGLPSHETYAELQTTVFDLTGPDYVSDSVSFFNKKYFKEPLRGRLTEKILASVKPETATYPRFDSYNLSLTIKEIIKDADYRGGFSMHGGKMIGSGSKSQKATLIFKRNNKHFLNVSARSFVVRPERISSDNAAVVIFFENDSISHPGLQFKYLSKEKQLSLVRNTESGIQMPFFNSFHQVDMMVDAIYWKIDDPLMEFKMTTGLGESRMKLESTQLYTDQRYEKIQGLAETSPLFILKQYAERNSRTIYIPDFAKSLRVNETNARSLIFFLAEQGFVNYDVEMDEAEINDKLYYYLSARSNKTDFDRFEIASVIDKIPNAKLNLLNFDLDLQGVSHIMLSDSQNVFIVPNDQVMKLKKNRDFEFSGRVHAGKTDFFGKKFTFIYDKFLFDLENVDSIRLKVETGEMDEQGKPKLRALSSTLQNVKGILYIDSLNNKSSRKSYSHYPYFVSEKESYVYYDRQDIHGGVYTKDKFYFKIDPFTIDSLDTYTAGSLIFDGEFVSAGIFPKFREKVVVRPDYSFGFEKDAPSEGFSSYGGKGKYFGHMDLSDRGFLGDGQIEYLSSTTLSPSFIFFPDSTNSGKAQFELKQAIVAGIGFPQATGKDVSINWQPYKDKMFVNKSTDNLSIYNGKVSLDGNLVLANKGLGGNGAALYTESTLSSKDFYFKPETYGADTSDFSLKSDDKDVLAITTQNVKSKIDLQNRYGEFVSNGKGSYVTFPLNQYICYIAQFKWYMDNREVEFSDDANTKLNIHGSDFVSINPYQDSLRWNAGVARYSLADYLIKARKVKEILVADASIQPDDSATIVIERNAVMRPLKNALVIANTATRHHAIVEADITIKGRKNYLGAGKYAYTDQAGVKHLLSLERISVDTSYQTYANGVISDTMNFQLNTNIQYKGKVNLIASNPLLNFDGFAIVKHSCTEDLETDWFGFNGDIDPNGVNIPVKDPRNETRQKLAVGISLTSDSSGFYSSFLTPKKSASDADVITAEGFLAYDAKSNTYKIASAEKLANPDEAGTSIALDNTKCIVTGDGKMDLSANFGQFKLTTIGKVTDNLNNDSVGFDVLMGLDFMFSEDALKAMVEVIESYPTLKATNDGRPVWIQGMRELLGKEAADKMTTEFNLYGSPKKVPLQLQSSIFLTDLKLTWNREAQAYRSKSAIGVGFVGKKAVSRLMNGNFEILRRRGNDVFSLYIEADKSTWWFFTYSRGIMQAISSDTKFNDAIQNLKPEKRIADTKDNKPPYEFMLSTDRKKAEFVKKMKVE